MFKVTLPKLTTHEYIVKTFTNFDFQNQKSDKFETRHGALKIYVLQCNIRATLNLRQCQL